MLKNRRSFLVTGVASALAFVVLAACAPLPAAPVSPIATPSQPTLEAPMSNLTPPPQAPAPSATQTPRPSVRTLAVADLAAHLGIAVDAITVISVEQVEWSDASLGCAKPGQMYAQVVTPGYRIVLEAGGQTYEYHTGEGRVVRCKP
jgi:hypothetical protein